MFQRHSRQLYLCPSTLLRRYYSISKSTDTNTIPITSTPNSKPIIKIPKSSSIHPFGDPSNRKAILKEVEWEVNEGEAWAVISATSGINGKGALFRTLLGHLRVSSSTSTSPSPSTSSSTSSSTSTENQYLYPFLGKDIDPYTRVGSVSFSHRSNQAGGAFYDYTARYGAVRDEDVMTLRESMFPESLPEVKPDPFAAEDRLNNDKVVKKKRFEEIVKLNEEDRLLFEQLVKEMDLERLLDVPFVTLSNGQKRRARIVRAILKKPEILLLDEPLTGLDIAGRPKLLQLLHKLHESQKPRIIIGLRTQDEIPEWITHLALVQDGTVTVGTKDCVIPLIKHDDVSDAVSSGIGTLGQSTGPMVMEMRNVNVKYGDNEVLKNINWQVRQGERWHLQGANGSGKTTLLSLVLGDHPQSYVQNHLILPSPPHPSIPSKYVLNQRKRIPTPLLRQSIGVVSPELADAFPRQHPGMSVWDAIGTGFEGAFVPLAGGGIGATGPGEESLRDWRTQRMWEMLENLGPSAWTPSEFPREVAQEFSRLRFSELGAGEQRVVLLMRALVGRPPLVLLDEVWSGMSEEMVRSSQKYLRERVGNDQAVVVVSHWESEVPWSAEDGVKRFVL